MGKIKELIISIIIDIVGAISAIPGLDVFFFAQAPISSYWIYHMMEGGNARIALMITALVEELFPLLPLDLIPSATIAWIYKYS